MKRMACYILFILILCKPISGQEDFHYFNKLYAYNGGTNIASIVFPLDDGILNIGVSSADTLHTILYCNKIDYSGNIVWGRSLDVQALNTLSFPQGGRCGLQSSDGHFVVTYQIVTANGDGDVCILKFDREANVIWRHEITKPFGHERDKAIYEWIPNQYYVVGDTGIFGVNQFAIGMLLVVDESGNLLIDQSYTLDESVSIRSMAPAADGGFLLSGFNLVYYPDNPNYELHVIKTDSLGEMQWINQIVSPDDDDRAYIYPWGEDEYLFAGEYGVHGITNGLDSTILYLARMDIDGNILWDSLYRELNQWRKIFLGSPFLFDDDRNIYLSYHGGSPGPYAYYLAKMDTNFNIIYQKDIRHSIGVADYVWDAAFIHGGIVWGGFKYTLPQYSWVFTTDLDFNTCFPGDCDSIGVSGMFPSLVLPDDAPVQYLHIMQNENQLYCTLDASIAEKSNLNLYVYDSQGRMTYHTFLDDGETSYTLTTTTWPAGIYIVSLRRGGQVLASERVLKM